jgi:RHS repeat-associated protein
MVFLFKAVKCFHSYDALQAGHIPNFEGNKLSYTYDPGDNLTHITGNVTLSAMTNVNNELPKVILNGTTATWTYDKNGNLLSDGTRTFTWDAENRLQSLALNGKPTKFVYDGLSRRTSITDNGIETRYLWCGEQICTARTATGTTTARYYPQGELNNGVPRYYARDRLGSVRTTMDNTGAAKGTATYDAYGRTKITGETPAFAYAGMFFHKPSGLYLTQYRAYNPDVGRWISRDPIGIRGGLNLYGYVGGKPTNYYDRTGQCPMCIVGIGVLLGAGAGGGASYYMSNGNLEATATGAVIGGATGAIAPVATAIAVEYGGATAGIATFSGVSSAGAASTTAITNYETGQPLGDDVALSAAIGAFGPLLSGEAPVAALIGEAAGIGGNLLGLNSGILGMLGAVLDKGFLNKPPSVCEPLGKGSPLGNSSDFGVG